MIIRVTALLACLATGCSIILIDSPKPLPEPPSCELTPWPVIADSVAAVGSLLTAGGFGIAAAIADSENNNRSNTYATTAEVLLVTGLVTAVSGGVGFYRLAKCSHAIDQYNALHAQPPQQPYPYPQQPYPPQPYPQQPSQQPYPQQPSQQPYPPQPYPPQPYPPQPYPPQQTSAPH